MKNKRLLRISYQVLSFLLTLSLIGVGFFIIIFIIGIFYPPILEIQNLIVSVPMKITDLQVCLADGSIITLSIDKVNATFDSLDKLPMLRYLSSLKVVIMTLVGIYFVYVTKILIRSAINNNPFNSRLFKNLKYATILKFCSIIFSFITNIIAQAYVANNIKLQSYSDLKITERIYVNFTEPLASLIIVIVIIAFAEILRQGALLKEEQDSII